ncbi:Uncharacterised protein [Staphylococcus caeli]|uniref:Uncharacterized protein n=1 Tax=Staphylococcus caeli TaxID=2201815 RepID=A0A1D4G438_9STAP|nr:Uncharacterised protein [Staphylococcus caeli]SCS45814.1 Uncharacterised protein [Staphylococcus caeli]
MEMVVLTAKNRRRLMNKGILNDEKFGVAFHYTTSYH